MDIGCQRRDQELQALDMKTFLSDQDHHRKALNRSKLRIENYKESICSHHAIIRFLILSQRGTLKTRRPELAHQL